MSKDGTKLVSIKNGIGSILSFVRGKVTTERLANLSFATILEESIADIDSTVLPSSILENEDVPLGKLQILDMLESEVASLSESIAEMNLDLAPEEIGTDVYADFFDDEDGEIGGNVDLP